MRVVFEAELRRVSKGREFERRNGEKDFNVEMLLECSDDSYTFPCAKEMLREFESGALVKGECYMFVADYQPKWKYNNFVIEKVEVPKK